MPMPDRHPEPPPPDLTRRYRMQVCFPEPGEPDDWETINSFSSPIEALRGCSECLEAVKDLLGAEPVDDFFQLRIRDAENGKLVLWEDDSGALQADTDFSAAIAAIQPS